MTPSQRVTQARHSLDSVVAGYSEDDIEDDAQRFFEDVKDVSRTPFLE